MLASSEYAANSSSKTNVCKNKTNQMNLEALSHKRKTKKTILTRMCIVIIKVHVLTFKE